MDYTITQHWATPIYRGNLNDDELVQSLLTLASEITTVLPTVEQYGTAAVFDNLLYTVQDERARKLYDNIQLHTRQFLQQTPNVHLLNTVTKLQLCVLNPGEVTGYHGHDFSFLTGIVYLSPQNTGLILHDPRANAARAFPKQLMDQFKDVTIVPNPGDVVIFPSYAYHSTMVHNGTLPRAVIPFNVMQQPTSVQNGLVVDRLYK